MPQGTIKTYDETSRSGVIMDDQKRELAFDADSFRHSGVRLFRIGCGGNQGRATRPNSCVRPKLAELFSRERDERPCRGWGRASAPDQDDPPVDGGTCYGYRKCMYCGYNLNVEECECDKTVKPNKKIVLKKFHTHLQETLNKI